MSADKAKTKALASATDATAAAARILAALEAGKTPELADAKVLEAVGCWTRRALAKGQL